MPQSPPPLVQCEFKFKYPKVWSALEETGSDGDRQCSACDRSVYLVTTDAELWAHAAQGHCVAVSAVDATRESVGRTAGG